LSVIPVTRAASFASGGLARQATTC